MVATHYLCHSWTFSIEIKNINVLQRIHLSSSSMVLINSFSAMIRSLHLCILVLDNFWRVPHFNFAIPAGASVLHQHIFFPFLQNPFPRLFSGMRSDIKLKLGRKFSPMISSRSTVKFDLGHTWWKFYFKSYCSCLKVSFRTFLCYAFRH